MIPIHKEKSKEVLFNKKFNNQLKQFDAILKRQGWEFSIKPGNDLEFQLKIYRSENNIFNK